jgi:hypothetical protein
MKKVAATNGHKVMRRDFPQTAGTGSTDLIGLAVKRLAADNADS